MKVPLFSSRQKQLFNRIQALVIRIAELCLMLFMNYVLSVLLFVVKCGFDLDKANDHSKYCADIHLGFQT